MNCNKMPDTGAQIFVNGCSCNLLWKELQAEAAEQHASNNKADAVAKEACMPRSDFESWPVGMAYVPMQCWEEPFDLAKGLRAGTIFPSLRLPFRGGGC